MRGFGLMILLLVFISCDNNETTETDLRIQVSLLETRIDSLEQKIQLLIDKQEPTISKKKNTTSSKKTSTPQNLVLSERKVEPKVENTALPLVQQPTTYKEPSSNSGVSQQCVGTTKKGSRCRRMVRGGSYCWQHGG